MTEIEALYLDVSVRHGLTARLRLETLRSERERELEPETLPAPPAPRHETIPSPSARTIPSQRNAA